jgi:hypothetical protein
MRGSAPARTSGCGWPAALCARGYRPPSKKSVREKSSSTGIARARARMITAGHPPAKPLRIAAEILRPAPRVRADPHAAEFLPAGEELCPRSCAPA